MSQDQDIAGRVEALGALVRRLHFAARRDYRFDLSHRMVRVLNYVDFRDEPPRIDDIARFLGCAVSTASELVKRLQQRGLVVRQRSEIDERVVEVLLTVEGEAALEDHTTPDPEKMAALLDRLSDRQQADLLRLMDRLAGDVDFGLDAPGP